MLDISDIARRIQEHRERERRLQDAAREAEGARSERRARLDDVEAIPTFSKDMSACLPMSEVTERVSFINSFDKEVQIGPGEAKTRYTISLPQDSGIAELASE